MQPRSVVTRPELLIAALAVFLGWTGTSAAAVGIGVFLDKNYVVLGQATPRISVSGFNNGADAAVDVHVGVISPTGVIYEFADWNTDLRPWLPGFLLPQGLSVPPTAVTDLNGLPGGLAPGIWFAAAALTEPGTLNLLSFVVAPFNVIDDSGEGSKLGALALTRSQTPAGVEVDASGMFASTAGSFDDLINGLEGQQPALDQCLYNEIAIDITATPSVSIVTLDAGAALQLMSSAGADETLPKDADAAAFGIVTYGTAAGQLADSFFQSGETYTFEGEGGPQISAFSAAAVAPPPLDLVAPALAPNATHDAGSDLQVTWNGNNGLGEVNVALAGSNLSSVLEIVCRFQDDGSGVVPAGLLTRLRDQLDSGSIEIPGLPDGITIPDLPGGITLPVAFGVNRVNTAMFNTSAAELNHGVVTVESGAAMPLTLQ